MRPHGLARARFVAALFAVLTLFSAVSAHAGQLCLLTSAQVSSLSVAAGSSNQVIFDTSDSATVSAIVNNCSTTAANAPYLFLENAANGNGITSGHVVTLSSGSTFVMTSPTSSTRQISYTPGSGLSGNEQISPVQISALDGTASSITVRFYPRNAAFGDYIALRVTVSAPAPTLTSLSATAANAVGSTSGGGSASNVTLNGSNLSGATSVSFGSATISSSAFVSNTGSAITVAVPSAATAGVSGAGGTVNVTATTAGGTTGAQSFTYVLTPTVSALAAQSNDNTPTISGTAAPGATINLTLTGPSPLTTSAITANGSGAWSYTPSARADGYYQVQVTQGLSTVTSSGSNQVNFAIDTVAPAAPVVLSPSEGQNTGSSIGINGTNESGAIIEVQVDSGAFSTATINGTSWSITKTGLTPGAHTITARASDLAGNGPTSSTVRNFNVLAVPTVTNVSPRFGTASGSTAVTLTGTGFENVIEVRFGGVAATNVVVGGPTQITLDAPAGSGTVDVTVTTPGGTSATSVDDRYTYVAMTLTPAAGALPSGTAGVGYSQTFTAGGGTAPYTHAVVAGAIPPGMSLSSGGTLSGTPTAVGSYNFTVRATDATSPSNGGPFTIDHAYSLVIAAPTITLAPTTLPSGTIAVPYSQMVTASGGTGAYTFAVVGSLPAGLALDPGTGVVSGTPSAGGTFNFTIAATDSTTGAGAPYSGSRAYSLTIAAPTLTLSPTSLPGATGGTAYDVTIGTTGGTAPYGYALTGSLPPGLTFTDATGRLQGTPTAAGSYNFSVTATDSSTGAGPYSGSRNYTLAVAAPTIALSPTSLPNGTGGIAYSQSLSASGGSGPYAFAVTGGALPPGLSLSSAGALTGTPQSSGTFNFTAQATDNLGFTASRSYALTIDAPSITLSSTLSAPAAGTAYSASISASGGTAPYGFTVSAGTLPSGLTLASDGTLSGTPAAAGSYSFTVRATDALGFSADRAYSGTVAAPTITLSSAALANGTIGASYSGSVNATGGTAPYSLAVTGGALPSGIAMDAGGVFSGTPTAAGTFNFTVTATDSTSGPAAPYTGSRAYAITVNAPTLVLAPATLANGAVGAPYSAAVSASGGTSPYAYTVTAGALPPGIALGGANGALTGTPTAAGTFNFTVTAADSSGGTGPFATNRAYALTIGSGTQTISFAPLSSASLSASPLTLSATASSGLTVSFASTTSSVCTVSGTSLTLLTTGTCSVTASQGGNGDWGAATDVTRSFTVTPASLALTAGAASGTSVGASYSQANPATGGLAPYSYALNAGALPPGTALGSDGTVTGTPTVAGTFSYQLRVTDSQGTPVTAIGSVVTTTIAKGNQTIGFTSTAPSGAVVGGTTYVVAATASSGLTVTFALDGTSSGCSLSGTTVSFTSTGTCRINASQAGDANWNAASSVQQSFAVSAAQPLTVAISYAPAPVNVGTIGTLTITFTNPNASTSPAFSSALHSNNVVFTRVAGLGGSCGIPSSNTSVPTTSQVNFGNITIPSGTCTVTLPYRAASAGTATFSFDAFTPAGYPASSSAVSSTIAALPSVTAVSPASGPVSAVVNLTGTGFSTTPGNNAVSFGGTAGTVTAATATSLTVTAPATGSGATPVTVTVNGQTSVSSASYTFIAKPVAADRPGVAVPYNSGGTAIDLSSSISGGPHTSIAIGTAPSHGTTSIAGDVVTYTPAAGYFGADSFTYTATGGGGTSNIATVSITVATPAPPVAADLSGVAVPYNGTGTAIDLSGSITGVHASIAIGTAPSHGTTSIAGDVVTYTPAAGYFGADSFTYTATGPGGTSNSGTVALTVATPPAPVTADRSGVAVPYASPGTAIDLSGSVTGVHSGIAIAAAPSHGTTSIAGDVVTYTPAAGYFGADSFTYTATGPGGTSTAATVSLTVATPAAPVAANRSGVAVPYGSSGTAIDLSASITGVHASIAISTAPAHGTVTIAGDVVTYTPASGYFGADSFTYTATGPGGTSAPATVSLTVATPAPPVAAGRSGVAITYNSSGTAIDLSGSITGVHSAIAIGTAPVHGTAAVSGDVVTYTPATGYYGADSFTYTATGPGGTSAAATVSVTVANPPAPVAADKSGVAVPYASAGTAIDLSASITGVHASIAIGTTPAHGTVTIAGDVVTYTPASGYFGADSFTYTATGPGGTSTPATVSLTVATPAAPVAAGRSGVAVAYNSSGTAIDLSGSITGVHSAIAIGTAPAHGTATVSGDVVTYTPASGYYGADSFTYTAAGPGGTSAAATVSVSVAAPPPPVASPAASTVHGSTIAAGTSVDIDLSALVTGVYDTIRIDTQPAHGTVVLRGGTAAGGEKHDAAPATPIIATYTPAPNYAGTDSFTFVAVGPGGTSSPATVTIAVVGQVPVARPKTAQAGDGQTVSVMLTDGATEGPFTGATIVSVTPSNAATATIVESGSGPTRAYRLDVAANNRFGGTVVVTYTLSNVFGTSAPATVTVSVTARPDPRLDPNVAAVSDAQAEATRRFARAQVNNFMRRTEQLHNGGGGTRPSMGVSLNSRDAFMPSRMRPDDKDWAAGVTERMRRSSEDPEIGRYANDPNSPLSRPDRIGAGRMLAADPAAQAGHGAATSGASGAPGTGQPDDAGDGSGIRRIGSIATWAGGAIDIGTRDATTDRTKITATTAGLSAGADIKLAEGVVVGLGGGYGNDLSRIGTAARVRGKSTIYAAYASIEPAESLFIDGMIGRGDLDFTTRRIIAAVNATAMGSRDGDYTVGAVSIGIDRGDGALQWSLYGRGEYLEGDLASYAESGAGRYDLRFDPRQIQSITGTLGGRIQYRQRFGFGSVTPRLRAEWNHEFADVDSQWLDYADIPGAAIYSLDGNGWKREQLQLSLGARFDILKGNWSFDVETGLRAGQGEKAGTLQIRISKEF